MFKARYACKIVRLNKVTFVKKWLSLSFGINHIHQRWLCVQFLCWAHHNGAEQPWGTRAPSCTQEKPQVSAARLQLKHKGGDTSERTSKKSQFRHAVKNSIASVGHDYSVYLGLDSNFGANEYSKKMTQSRILPFDTNFQIKHFPFNRKSLIFQLSVMLVIPDFSQLICRNWDC